MGRDYHHDGTRGSQSRPVNIATSQQVNHTTQTRANVRAEVSMERRDMGWHKNQQE